MEAACALQVDGQFGQLLARAYRDELVERPFRTRRHAGLHHQSRPDIDRIESGAHRIIARDLLTDAAQIGRASCRERVCQAVLISVVRISLKQKTTKTKK